jgi:hypothetical protein
MKISPVKNYKELKYPTLEKYIYTPEKFLQYVPVSWKFTKAVLVSLISFVIAGVTNIKARNTLADKVEVASDAEKEKTPEEDILKTREHITSNIAPVFVHGEGRGAIGCVVVAPPVFLSEEEARQVVVEEFKKIGIELDAASYKYGLDGYSNEYKIGFEVVTAKDVFSFRTGSVKSWNLLKKAEKYRNKLSNNKGLSEGKVITGVFYDPLQKYLSRYSEGYVEEHPDVVKSLGDAQIKSKELLSAQVVDFIDWLRTERLLPDTE